MSNQPEPGAGNVTFELIDGEKVTLTPSLEACLALTSDPRGLFGGEASIYGRVQRFDLTVIAHVIRVGTGTGASGAKYLEKKLYETGLSNLINPINEFLGLVVTGGRPVKEEEVERPPEDPAAES